MADRNGPIVALEKALGCRVVIVAASWRADTKHDLGVDAARAFVEVFDSLGDERPERVALFVVARGGHASFADQVVRSLRGTHVPFDVVVPTFCNGVATLLALGADAVTVHPHGALGAYDAGPLTADAARLDHDLVDFVPPLGGIHYQNVDAHLPSRLASGVRHRQLCRELAERTQPRDEPLAALSHLHLGTATGLGAARLAELGFEVRGDDTPEVWDLFLAVEDALDLKSTPPLPYTESDLGAEVEFEPATGLVAALIESSERTVTYVVDTGQLHPETGNYVGYWNW